MTQRIKRTNVEGTCLWCGKKLIGNYHFEDQERHDRVVTVNDYGEERQETRSTWRPKPGAKPQGYGYRSQGYFCTLTHAWRFALAVAKGGVRLKEYTDGT